MTADPFERRVEVIAGEHGWSVDHVVVGPTVGGANRYRPRCVCGWEGVLCMDQASAARRALNHVQRARGSGVAGS